MTSYVTEVTHSAKSNTERVPEAGGTVLRLIGPSEKAAEIKEVADAEPTIETGTAYTSNGVSSGTVSEISSTTREGWKIGNSGTAPIYNVTTRVEVETF
jgi:hypothetical protein